MAWVKRPTQRAPEPRQSTPGSWWESPRFQAVCCGFKLGSVKVALSRPAHQRVPTPTGRCAGVLRKRQPLGGLDSPELHKQNK